MDVMGFYGVEYIVKYIFKYFDPVSPCCVTRHEAGTSFWISNFERFSKNILPMYDIHNHAYDHGLKTILPMYDV